MTMMIPHSPNHKKNVSMTENQLAAIPLAVVGHFDDAVVLADDNIEWHDYQCHMPKWYTMMCMCYILELLVIPQQGSKPLDHVHSLVLQKSNVKEVVLEHVSNPKRT
jgi:hypothetical protein